MYAASYDKDYASPHEEEHLIGPYRVRLAEEVCLPDDDDADAIDAGPELPEPFGESFPREHAEQGLPL